MGGKGKAPPPKAKAKMLSPRALAGGRDEDAEGSCMTPFGRKIHWVQPSYQEPAGDSIFGKLGSSGPQFDPKLLTAIFTPDQPQRKRSWSAQKDVGKCILDTQRAQGAAIMVNRLKMSTVELCRCVNTLDFDDVRLRVDDIEMVSMAMPTPEESAKLLKETEVAQLRDIEQKLIPLCALNVGCMRVMKFGLLHASLHADIIGRCGVIRTAAEEAQRSTQFMEFLRLSLQVGNFINHGEAEMRTGMVRSFALESLQMLSSCKAGPVSALHFVCLTLRSEDPSFLQSLKDSLSHSREASREKAVALEADVANFSKEVQFLKQRFERLEPEDELKGKMQRLLDTVEQEDQELKTLIRKSLTAVSDAQSYFNVSVKEGAKPPTSDQFFSGITSTLENFQTAWREVERNGRRWERKLEGVGSEMGLSRPGSSKAVKSKTVPLDVHSDASNSGTELTKAAPTETDGVDAFTPSRVRKSCPAVVEKTPSMRLNKGKRSLKGGGMKLGQATRRMSPYLPKTSPRITPRIEAIPRSKVCEFHAIHEQDSNSDTNLSSPKLTMPRSSTAFPDLCEFQREPTGQAERTWDFAISGTSAYSMSLWRRQKQMQKQLSPHLQQQQQQQEQPLRQKTC